ncbi:YbaB/EbfC family nucleoid-associated protein [Erysipelotrichaceae bacterium OH741_COT-311]|nr:YbaB/EbfC family nucleoid-associated protein [Erysipelotrichaceae bacterium OH741_COT-311]
MDLSKLMKQAQQMQRDLAKQEEALKAQVYEGSASNNQVVVTVSGEQKVLSLEIAEELINKEDKDILQDLVMIAINDALTKASDDRAEKMDALTAGIKVPGMF